MAVFFILVTVCEGVSIMSSQKVLYKIKNWNKYNKSLVNRGNITLWFTEETIDKWLAPREKKVGRPVLYSDDCIKIGLIFRFLFQLPLRATQGFLEGLLTLMQLDLPVPDYSQLCRRAKSLTIDYKTLSSKKKGSIDLVIDSTGLKVYGEGEWKMRAHGKSKRRSWKKLHLSLDPKNFQVISMELSSSKRADGKVLPGLIAPIKDKIGKVYADAAYMYKECFEAIDIKGGRAIIDLRGGTSLSSDSTGGLKQRNRIVKEIRQSHFSRKDWKLHSGYHRRSLVETQMYRWKQILGSRLLSRKFSNQEIEAKLKTMILNKMTALGMPRTQVIKT